MARFRSGVALSVRKDRVRYALTVVATTVCLLAMLAVAQAILYVRDRKDRRQWQKPRWHARGYLSQGASRPNKRLA